ncbi:hypothetical protein BDW22DRAFT_1358271 [Trametopsis cervina]|nr:hypothetical protein BDW22DRAFT_1358271 [Trametopsis cervina]
MCKANDTCRICYNHAASATSSGIHGKEHMASGDRRTHKGTRMTWNSYLPYFLFAGGRGLVGFSKIVH